MKGFIVYTNYITANSENQIQLFGRLENNQSFAAIFPFTPYFFVEEKDLKKVKLLLEKFKTEKTKLTNFKGEKVVKISANNQTDLNKLSATIHKKNLKTYEADIKSGMRFMIDNDLFGPIEIEGDYKTENLERVDRLYKAPDVKPIKNADFKPALKIISLDIETSKKNNELFCIGLYGKSYKKCFIIGKKEIENAVICKDEKDLLLKFKEEIIKQDPDIITGWSVIDFDLAYLREIFEKNKIPFDIGRNNDNIKIKIESGFFRNSTADIPGRQVLDALNFVRDPFIKEAPSIKSRKFESYTLENVSEELLGDTKLLKGKGRYDEIEKLFKNDQKKLVEYNLKDCQLAYDILDKTKIKDLAIEKSSLTGLSLNRIAASIATFDSLYIREARKRDLVSPTTQFGNKEERIKGGYVMQSTPGIYHNLIVLDFKSLYPSIIKTFNIDPASFLEKKDENSIEAPNKAYFKNQEGILPEIIEKLHQAREKAKAEKRELASYSIKTIMNSLFGVLASPNCRYFSLKMANAITHFGQFIIKLTAKKIEEFGYEVIYSDTDSVFVKTNLDKKDAQNLGLQIQNQINSFYEEYITKKYKRKSYLELEFEKLYLAFMMPPIRHSETGSKKRYAGLVEKNGKEEIEIVGLEAIRVDWTEAAQEFQIQLLEKVFKKEEFVRFIKEYVKKIKEGKLDSKLIYRKSITKELSKYTKTTPPHVKAARQLDSLDSNIIQYYMTTQGPEPIQKLKHKIDYEHYIEKQIEPIANTILFFFDKSFEEIIKGSKQMKLF